jgi:hypothetical protein
MCYTEVVNFIALGNTGDIHDGYAARETTGVTG